MAKGRRSVRIGNKLVGDENPTYVVAELGINHNGDPAIAKKLIDIAVAGWCDAVKFQKRTVTDVYTEEELAKPREVPRSVLEKAIERHALPAENEKRLRDSNFKETTNGDQKWALEFTEDEYKEIDRYCHERAIDWFASPWDVKSVEFLGKFNVPAIKIASASLTDDAILRAARSLGKPVILSTGMSTMEEIEHAVSVLGEEDLIILHCTSTYPGKLEELNHRVIHTLKEKFPVNPVGYSCHSTGVVEAVIAVVTGASLVEKHITLDRSMYGSDQAASLEPGGLYRMVRDIRNIPIVMGDGVKRVYDSERPILEKLRRVKGSGS